MHATCTSLLALTLLLAPACGTEPAAHPPPAVAEQAPAQRWPEGNLLPLEAGRRWTWQVRSGGRRWSVAGFASCTIAPIPSIDGWTTWILPEQVQHDFGQARSKAAKDIGYYTPCKLLYCKRAQSVNRCHQKHDRWWYSCFAKSIYGWSSYHILSWILTTTRTTSNF